MVGAAINFKDTTRSFTFDETNDAYYKISIRLQCQKNEVAVEVEGKKTVRISIGDGNGAVIIYEVLMPEDVKLKHTTAAFNGGQLTVTVPKRAGLTLLRPELDKTSITIS